MNIRICSALLICFLAISNEVSGDKCPRKENVNGRNCLKRCSNDADCVSSRKRCLCDGDCGKSCINPNIKCPELPSNIPNGGVDIIPYNRFSAVAEYTCADGYVLVGVPARVCQGDETWNGEEPVCTLNRNIVVQECGPPPLIHHATHDGVPGQMKFSLGTMLQYMCNDGFSAPKESVFRAWCVGDGVWVGPNMTCAHAGCPLLPPIEHGTVHTKPPNMIGAVARYVCLPGYHMYGREQRVCLPDGIWDGREPSCEKVTCAEPPTVEHASNDAPRGKKTFQTGDQLLYTCDFGFQREGQPRAMCEGDGSWNGPKMTCLPRNCGFPGDVGNGWREGFQFNYPNRVTYHCNEGYELTGRPHRLCQPNGEWSGTLPKCRPVECQELRPPLHGTMMGSGTEYFTKVQFACNDGYKVVGSSERRCLADRTWSGQEAICEEINCGYPGPIPNGYMDGVRTTVGAVFYFRCNVRTTFDGPSFSTQCMENGQWSEKPPKCWGQCQVPTIQDGKVIRGREGVWVDHATNITFQCKNGLHLNDSSGVKCLNGSWSYIPRCVPAPCSVPPPNIENGHRVFIGRNHQDKARYYCMDGFRIHGSVYMQCEFGRWSGNMPHCKEVYCENPGTLKHGKIYKKGSVGKFLFKPYIVTIRHGDRLEYECDKDFIPDGPPGATCINGEWSPKNKPRCIEARHPVFRKIWRPVQEMEIHYQFPYE